MYDFIFEKFSGDSLDLEIDLLDSVGTPVNLTTITVRFGIGSVITESSSGVTISTGTPSLGIITINVTYTAMATLTDYQYDLEVETTDSSTGVRDTLFVALLTLKDNPRG